MMMFLQSLLAFIVALGILVAVHEWGHFIVARWCGVHVERFSIGFGKPFWTRVDKKGTEFAIAAIPLGGYVRMLDERIDDVPDYKRHLAFNNKPVLQRMAIIVAGPAVNFIFAVLALFLMFLIGQETVKPVVGEIKPASIASAAQLEAGMEIVEIGGHDTPDWESVNLELVSAIGGDSVDIVVRNDQKLTRQVTLDINNWNFDPDKESALNSLGIVPFRPAITLEVAIVSENSPASMAGIQQGDVLRAINDEPIESWLSLVERIQDMPGQDAQFMVSRDGQERVIDVTIARRDTPEGQRGFLGVSPLQEAWPDGYLFTHQYGPVDAMQRALAKTGRLTVVSIDMLGKLVTGDVSLNNLSGPISIAQGAGASASYGVAYFLSFLALISVSLGIINLLPIPMLDGGHLLFFTVEWLTGKPVPEGVQEWGFKIGGALLFTMMSIAIFNDISRVAG